MRRASVSFVSTTSLAESHAWQALRRSHNAGSSAMSSSTIGTHHRGSAIGTSPSSIHHYDGASSSVLLSSSLSSAGYSEYQHHGGLSVSHHHGRPISPGGSVHGGIGASHPNGHPSQQLQSHGTAKDPMLAPNAAKEKRPARYFTLDSKMFDMDQLIRDAVIKNNIKVTRDFEPILNSTELQHFVESAIVYIRAVIREQLIRSQDKASRSWMDVPPAFLRQINDISRQEFFDTETLSLNQAREDTISCIHNFSLSYCFLLLFTSRHSRAPAKERYHFESMYTIVMDVVKIVLSMHSLKHVIDSELKRLFRSPLFATEMKQDVIDPIQMQFLAAMQDQRSARHEVDDGWVPAWAATSDGASQGRGSGDAAAAAAGKVGSNTSIATTTPQPTSNIDEDNLNNSDAIKSARNCGSANNRSTTLGGIGRWGPNVHGPHRKSITAPPIADPSQRRHMGTPRLPSQQTQSSANGKPVHRGGLPGSKPRARTAAIRRNSIFGLSLDGIGAPNDASGVTMPGLSAINTSTRLSALAPVIGHDTGEGDGGIRASSASRRSHNSRPVSAVAALVTPATPTSVTLGARPDSSTHIRHKKISVNAVRMLRSPIANETLPPVQRFLFVQSRPGAISSVVG